MKYNVLQLLLKYAFIGICVVIFTSHIWGQVENNDLILFAQDVRIVEEVKLGGFFLFIRKKNEINSVLLAESAETPTKDSNTYAFRTSKFNSINGNEKRVLNGRFIQSKLGYFVIDNTPEPDLEFGLAYVLFLPYELQYGYTNTRNGKIDLRQTGAYLSLRTFSKPYADYAGSYKDNSFYLERVADISDPPTPDVLPPSYNLGANPPEQMLNLFNSPSDNVINPLPQPQPEVLQTDASIIESPTIDTNILDELLSSSSEKYSPETINNFKDIAKKTNGKAILINSKDDIVDNIANILSSLPKGKSSDIVILLDTTRSMWDDLSILKSRLLPTISRTMRSEVYRIGMVLYRDQGEEYVTKKYDFSDQLDEIQRNLNAIQASGGGDWPESVYEALQVGIEEFPWLSESRVIFIVGDAPAHEPPNTEVNIDQIYSIAAVKKITLYPFIVPRRE